MLKTMGLGLGGRILTAKEEKFAKEELFFEYFTFLTWRLGGENSPYGEGSCSPLTEDSEIRFAWLMQRGWKHPSPYRLGDLAVQRSTIINRKSQPRRRRLPLFMGQGKRI